MIDDRGFLTFTESLLLYLVLYGLDGNGEVIQKIRVRICT
jgi:hypothetical protein